MTVQGNNSALDIFPGLGECQQKKRGQSVSAELASDWAEGSSPGMLDRSIAQTCCHASPIFFI